MAPSTYRDDILDMCVSRKLMYTLVFGQPM